MYTGREDGSRDRDGEGVCGGKGSYGFTSLVIRFDLDLLNAGVWM